MTPAIRFRLTVDGEVVDDVLIEDPEVAATYARRHADTCAAVDARGGWWLLEITDPDGLFDPVRQSNRADLFDHPIAATDENVAAEIAAREHQLRSRGRNRE